MTDPYSSNSTSQTETASRSISDCVNPSKYGSLFPHVTPFLDPYYTLLIRQQMHLQNERHYSLHHPYQQIFHCPTWVDRHFQQQLTSLVDNSALRGEGKPLLLSHTLVRAEHLLTHQTQHQLFRLPSCKQQQQTVLLEDSPAFHHSHTQYKAATVERSGERTQVALSTNDSRINCSFCHKVILSEGIFRHKKPDPSLQERFCTTYNNEHVNDVSGVKETSRPRSKEDYCLYTREYLLNAVYHQKVHNPNSLPSLTTEDLAEYYLQNNTNSCDCRGYKQWNHNRRLVFSETYPVTNQTKWKHSGHHLATENTLNVFKSKPWAPTLDAELIGNNYRPDRAFNYSKNTDIASEDSDVKRSHTLPIIPCEYKCKKNVAPPKPLAHHGHDKDTPNNVPRSCSSSVFRPMYLDDCTITNLSSSPSSSSSSSLKQQSPDVPLREGSYGMSKSGVNSDELPDKCQQTQTNQSHDILPSQEHAYSCLIDAPLLLASKNNMPTHNGDLTFSVQRILASQSTSTIGKDDIRSTIITSQFNRKTNGPVCKYQCHAVTPRQRSQPSVSISVNVALTPRPQPSVSVSVTL